MPRSGSELLQVLLHQNPDIYGSATSPLLEYQFAARNNFSITEVSSQPQQLMKAAFINMCSAMAQGYYRAITERPNIIDKNRGWLHYFEWVEMWCEKPKMVCVVRDLRAIIGSMERIYRKNRYRPVGPDNPQNLINMTVEARADYWLNTQPVGLALQRLYDLFQRNLNNKVLFLRYEDLIKSPQKTLNKWYDFVELPKFKHQFDNIVKTIEEDSSLYGPYGDHTIHKTIRNPPLWSETLPENIGNKITKQYDWYFQVFNYN